MNEQHDDDVVYKILTVDQWNAFQAAQEFTGSAADLSDGFIHLSGQNQVAETAQKYFADQDPIVLVAVSTAQLGEQLKWEKSRGGQSFPHLYATLAMQDVVQHWQIKKSENGEHLLPSGF